MALFFTGCTHFGHENIISLARRPFTSVEQMDEIMVENWNKTVKPGDGVFHLGDVAWSRESFAKNVGRLNGNITFIKGNHDKSKRVPENRFIPYMDVQVSDKSLVLFHYPIEEWDGWWRGALHLHCHTHKPDLVSGNRRFNVGVDATAFKPISLEEILDHPNSRTPIIQS